MVGHSTVEWSRALDIRLTKWCCSVSMVWVQIPSREEQNLTALKSNSNNVWFNFQTYIYIYIYTVYIPAFLWQTFHQKYLVLFLPSTCIFKRVLFALFYFCICTVVTKFGLFFWSEILYGLGNFVVKSAAIFICFLTWQNSNKHKGWVL
jgi:hypothetical protein